MYIFGAIAACAGLAIFAWGCVAICRPVMGIETRSEAIAVCMASVILVGVAGAMLKANKGVVATTAGVSSVGTTAGPLVDTAGRRFVERRVADTEKARAIRSAPMDAVRTGYRHNHPFSIAGGPHPSDHHHRRTDPTDGQ
jgi:hypothetical protein